MILMKSKQNIKLETCHTVLPVTPSCTRLVQEGLVVSLHYFLAQSSLSMLPCHTSLTHPWLFLPPPNPVPGKHIIAQNLETLENTSGLRSKMLWRAGSVINKLPPVGGDALKSSVIPSPFHLVKKPHHIMNSFIDASILFYLWTDFNSSSETPINCRNLTVPRPVLNCSNWGSFEVWL